MHASVQLKASKITITEVRAAAQLLWWLKKVNVHVLRILFLLSVVILKEPFLCVLVETTEEMTQLHFLAKTTIKSRKATQTRIVALCSKIAPHCVPSDTVSQSSNVSICPLCCLGFIISKSAQQVWLPRDQWYRRYKINKGSIKFWSFPETLI